MKNPCHECQTRHYKCHSECFKYSIFVAVEERRKEKIHEANKADYGYISYRSDKAREIRKSSRTGEYSKK